MQVPMGLLASRWDALQSKAFLLGKQVCLPWLIIELWGKNFSTVVIFAFKGMSSEKLWGPVEYLGL